MRYYLVLLLLCLNGFAFAQKPDSKVLANAVADFDKALVGKDSLMLKKLLSDDLSYGHSNGWIQLKKEVIGDLYNGKLTYKTINPAEQKVTIDGNTASVRMYADVDVVMEGKPMQFKLKVLQVWIWKNKHWELFARQSVKA